MPQSLDRLFRKEVLLQAFSQRSRENARRAEHELFGVQNSRKARGGQLAGLQDPAIMARKKSGRTSAPRGDGQRSEIERRSRRLGQCQPDSLHVVERFDTELDMLEHGWAFDSRLFGIARTLVRLPVEDAKPNADRLPEFGESSRPSLEQQLVFHRADLRRFRNAQAGRLAFDARREDGGRQSNWSKRFWRANRRAIGRPN